MTFLMFGKYSTEAIKEISPDRTHKAAELIKQYGGEIVSMYALLGDIDLVLVVELPDVVAAVKASVALNKLSGIGFTTAPALTVGDFDKLISN